MTHKTMNLRMPAQNRGTGTMKLAGISVLAVVTVMAGLSLTACGAKKKPAQDKQAQPSVLIESTHVAQTSAPFMVTGSGTILSWQEAPVGSEVGGLTAVALLVDEGQVVKQGQPLLKMDDVLLRANVQQAEANANQAKKAYMRSKELFDKGYQAASALDTAMANYQTTEAALNIAQTNLSLATVKAPVSGIIVSRKAVLGQIVTQGAELFRIVRDSRIEMNMNVVESQLSLIKPGMVATIKAENGKPVSGTVRIVTPMVDSSTRLGVVRISVPWESGLRPGMFASAEIKLSDQPALMIPQKAVVYHDDKAGVFVIDGANKVHYRSITTGDTQGQNVLVTSGLDSSDVLVTTGAGFLNDGDLVAAHSAQGQ